MKSQVVLLCFSALVAVSLAQHCGMPQMWEAMQTKFDPNERHNSTFFRSAKYSYDGVNQRKHRSEELIEGDEGREYYAVLELFEDKVAYVTNLKTKECHKEALTEPFHRHDIAAGAHYGGEITIGSGQESVTETQWFSHYRGEHRDTVDRYQTFTSIGCVPIRDDRFSDYRGFVYEEFADVTLGIHDPNIWTPPPNCQ